MVRARLLELLDARTVAARRRLAVTDLVLGSAAWSDRALARAYFEAAAPYWRDHQADPDRVKVAEAALDAVTVTPSAVVELGCGAGDLARRAALRWPDASVVGYDVSARMIACARGLRGPANLRFDRADAHRVRTQADVVLVQNYLPHPGHVRRLLPAGGEVAVIFSFQNLCPTVDLGGRHWELAGFACRAAADVGAGSYEVYRAA